MAQGGHALKPLTEIDATEGGRAPRSGKIAFDLERHLDFSTAALESYAFAEWEPLLYDAMVVAATIEFADRSVSRPRLGWGRKFALRIPVHEPRRWAHAETMRALIAATTHLTGDEWSFEFVRSQSAAPVPGGGLLALDVTTRAVMPFSDGLDSRAVACIVARERGTPFLRVRVGAKAGGRPKRSARVPFAAVPYGVKAAGETSARSRGFKFLMIAGIAAHLSGADDVLVSESGQGVFGPALVTAAHAYPDFRSHPLFAVKMESLLALLFGRRIRIVFPRLWSTKGETIRLFAELEPGDGWRQTRSCWMDSRHCSVQGVLMQCGVCAACMLRRMSIHAAGLTDDNDAYVCAALDASTLDNASVPGFKHLTVAFREYAIAGTKHLDHMASLERPFAANMIRRHSMGIASALNMSEESAHAGLRDLLARHAAEWRRFVASLGERSFVRNWARGQHG